MGNGMDQATATKIIDKIDRDTISELSKYFRYWYRSYKNLGATLTQEYCMEHVHEVMEKKVSELNNHDTMIMFIHLLIGDDFPVNDPKQEETSLSEEGKDCIETAFGCMNIFTKTWGDKINKLFNAEDRVPLLKMKHVGDLTNEELLILISNINWDK